jgi:hypothetical protein
MMCPDLQCAPRTRFVVSYPATAWDERESEAYAIQLVALLEGCGVTVYDQHSELVPSRMARRVRGTDHGRRSVVITITTGHSLRHAARVIDFLRSVLRMTAAFAMDDTSDLRLFALADDRTPTAA